MAKTIIVNLGPGDTAIIRGDPPELTRRSTPDSRSEQRVDNYLGDILPPPTMEFVCSPPPDPEPVPDPEPEPDPVPGTVLAFFTNEVDDFGKWEFDPMPALFQMGRSKTSFAGEPLPPIVGSHDLRMKYKNNQPSGGLFALGQKGVARRSFKVGSGPHTLRIIGVAHDDGIFTTRLKDKSTGLIVMEETGTDPWHNLEYTWKDYTFHLVGEEVELEVEYTAPLTLKEQSGVKLGYGEFR